MSLARAWNRFWFSPISARPIGLFRMLFGFVALLHLLILTDHFDYWLTGAGLMQGTEAYQIAGILRPSVLHWFQSPLFVRTWFALTVVFAFMVMVGWRTRIFSCLFYFFLLMITNRMIPSVYGGDSLILTMAFYLMLVESGAAYSLDSLRRKKSEAAAAERVIVPWPIRLLQVQISIMYFMTAFFKAGGKTWQEGTALHYVLLNEEMGRWLRFLTEYPIVINVATYSALMLEFLLPFFLWMKATRPYAALAGVILHVGIMFSLNVPIFGELCIIGYLIFLSPLELDALLIFLSKPLGWFGLKGARVRSVRAEPSLAHARVEGPAAA